MKEDARRALYTLREREMFPEPAVGSILTGKLGVGLPLLGSGSSPMLALSKDGLTYLQGLIPNLPPGTPCRLFGIPIRIIPREMLPEGVLGVLAGLQGLTILTGPGYVAPEQVEGPLVEDPPGDSLSGEPY